MMRDDTNSMVMQDSVKTDNDNNYNVELYVIITICIIFLVLACLIYHKKNIILCRKGYTQLNEKSKNQNIL